LEHLCINHIDSHVRAQRSGLHTSSGPGPLEDPAPLQQGGDRSYVQGRVRVDAGDRIRDGFWYSGHVYLDDSAGMPQTIITLYVKYCGNDTSLTCAEVCGLLHHMYQWYSLREFRQHAIGPVSLLYVSSLLDTGSPNCTDRCWPYRICIPNMQGLFKLITMGRRWFCSNPLL
jgi:hypothetical protein